MHHPRPGWLESFGLLPLSNALRDARTALFGAADLPATRLGPSGLALLDPRLGIPLWFSRAPVPRKVILSNLFNHTQTPIELGWSTRRTRVRDFRGRKSTYDSHNGTDLCVPRGTVVLAPASGQVGRLFREFHRGGLKIALDHGRGLMTCYAHLARALVSEGELVANGQPIAISAYSGLDGLATFPWGIPHVHFNVWLDGVPVDPFPVGDETPIWRGGVPRPIAEPHQDDDFEPSVYAEERLEAAIRGCVTEALRRELESVGPLWRRGAYLVSSRCYYPTRFADPVRVHADGHERAERLDLPFSAADFDGWVFRDEL